MPTNDTTRVRGFAWCAFHEPSLDVACCGERPFAASSTGDRCWWIEGTEGGIRNPVWGNTYLIVTDTPELPRVARGWSIEPADLDENFQSEVGEVRLTRTFGVRRTPWGIVQECEFAAAGSDLSNPAVSH